MRMAGLVVQALNETENELIKRTRFGILLVQKLSCIRVSSFASCSASWVGRILGGSGSDVPLKLRGTDETSAFSQFVLDEARKLGIHMLCTTVLIPKDLSSSDCESIYLFAKAFIFCYCASTSYLLGKCSKQEILNRIRTRSLWQDGVKLE